MKVLHEKIRELRPVLDKGRQLNSFKGIIANPVYKINKLRFKDVVMNTASRLLRGQIADFADENSDNSDDNSENDSDNDVPGAAFE